MRDSVIVAITSCAISAKSYKKSKRLEFFQRRDQLFRSISDLNTKTSEAHLTSARFGLVILNRQPLVVGEQYAEEQKSQIARMTRVQEAIELEATRWDETIKQLHSMCSRFTFGNPDAARMENLIAMVQVATDEAKRINEIHSSTLHTLETVTPMMRASMAEIRELERLRDQLDSAIKETPGI